MVSNWRQFNQLLDFFTPGYCLLCESLIPDGYQLCMACNADCPVPGAPCPNCGMPLRGYGDLCSCTYSPSTIDRLITVQTYQYPVNTIIHAMKYQQQVSLCREVGLRLAEKVQRSGTMLPDCLVPVPMHRKRLRERGYNQALEIARVIANSLDLYLEADLVLRKRPTATQIGLNPTERFRNVKGAFSLSREMSYDSIAIIDDVFTTGATALELANILKIATARRVELWSYSIATT